MGIGDPQGEALELATRNFGAQPGYELRDGVELAGWERQSMWGYDFGLRSFYAQFWRNGNRDDAPDFNFSGFDRTLPWPACLVGEMVEAMECTPVEAMDALGLRDPHPTFASQEALEALLEVQLDRANLIPLDIEAPDRVYESLLARDVDRRVVGILCTTLWLLGLADTTPASSLHLPATPATIMAERHMATSSVYSAQYNADYLGGVDSTLHWSERVADVENFF